MRQDSSQSVSVLVIFFVLPLFFGGGQVVEDK